MFRASDRSELTHHDGLTMVAYTLIHAMQTHVMYPLRTPRPFNIKQRVPPGTDRDSEVYTSIQPAGLTRKMLLDASPVGVRGSSQIHAKSAGHENAHTPGRKEPQRQLSCF